MKTVFDSFPRFGIRFPSFRFFLPSPGPWLRWCQVSEPPRPTGVYFYARLMSFFFLVFVCWALGERWERRGITHVMQRPFPYPPVTEMRGERHRQKREQYAIVEPLRYSTLPCYVASVHSVDGPLYGCGYTFKEIIALSIYSAVVCRGRTSKSVGWRLSACSFAQLGRIPEYGMKRVPQQSFIRNPDHTRRA